MIAIVLHDIQRKAGSLNRGSLPLGFLLALIGPEKESNNLCAGAAIVRPEQAITNAVGDAVLHRPCHSVCIVAIGKNIAELCLAIDQLTNGTDRKVTLWARVQVASGLNLPSPVPVVIPFSTAHATALA